MTGITIEVTSSNGEIYDLKLDGFNSASLMMKLPIHMNRFLKKVEKVVKFEGNKVKKQEVTFHGSWNILILNRFTKGLDARGIKWWLDP